MRPYRRFESLQQMSYALATFAVIALLLESAGLQHWAERLDLGPERTIALPAANALHRVLAPLRLENLRQHTLVGLARIRWSDDPEALEEAAGTSVPAESSAGVPGTIATITAPNAAPTPGHAPAAVSSPVTPPSTPLPLVEGAPPLLTSLPAIPLVEAGHMRTVALAGDSMMAVGLSSTLLREGPQYKDINFIRAFKSGTGLARPEVFNWQQEYPAMLQQRKPDFVIVAIGANDGQGFVEGGVTYQFGTPGWQDVYQRRVKAYIDMLTANGATVIWLELPPMKSPVYDARIALVNRIALTVVKSEPHAIWFSTAGIIGDGNGRFRDIGNVDGKAVKLRQGDGIHLSDEGGELLAAKLLPWLAAQAAPPPAPAATSAPASNPPAAAKPEETPQ
jgi:hypothetical protein